MYTHGMPNLMPYFIMRLQVSVNEAAAQLCLVLPALLTRRDELFPLARQVVRDSGYQYSKGHSRSQFQQGFPSKLMGSHGSGPGSANGGGSDGGGGNLGDDSNHSRDSTNGGSRRSKRMRLSEDDEIAGATREEVQMRRTVSSTMIRYFLMGNYSKLRQTVFYYLRGKLQLCRVISTVST
jgi:hypothetical protein